MAKKKTTTTLAEFTKVDTAKPGYQGWFSKLPDHIQREAVDGKLGGASYGQIARWLKAIGHTDATDARVSGGIKNYIAETVDA